MTEIEALRLYEHDGDATASLKAYQSMWKREDEDIDSEKLEEKLCRDHNMAVLHALCSTLSPSRTPETDTYKYGNEENLLQTIVKLHQRHLESIFSPNKDDKIGDKKNDMPVVDFSSDCGMQQLTFIMELLIQHQKEHSDMYSTISQYHSILHDVATNNKNAVSVETVIKVHIITHNLALLLLCAGRPQYGLNVLSVIFSKFILQDENDNSDDNTFEYLREISCRICFLLLDCILTIYKGDARGLPQSLNYPTNPSEASDNKTTDSFTLDSIISWIESHIERYIENNKGESKEDYSNETKFRLHLYKARVLFLTQQNLKQDVKTRQSKKEMKSALEIFQHKLRNGSNSNNNSNNSTTTNKTNNNSTAGSVESSEVGASNAAPAAGEEKQDNDISDHHHHYNQGSKKLDLQNQCALYLKANLEHLKQNYKKSLILCNEARLAGDRNREQNTTGMGESDENPETKDFAENPFLVINEHLDSAIHFSNLGCVLQSTGRLHMALHYYTKALASIDKVSSLQQEYQHKVGGMLRPVPKSDVLHNTAICALQLKKWPLAYECMAKCVVNGSISGSDCNLFAKRPRSWLRMAEACIGIHEASMSMVSKDYRVKVTGGGNGVSPRLIIEPPPETYMNDKERDFKLSQNLGSPDDTTQVTQNPLPRALSCLRVALTLCTNDVSNPIGKDVDCLEATRLSLAYVLLEMEEYVGALDMAMLVYGKNDVDQESYNNSNANRNSDATGSNIVRRSLSRRRKATARLYACEAYCRIGDTKEAVLVLCGEPPAVSEDNDSDIDTAQKWIGDAGKKIAMDLAMVIPRDHGSKQCRREEENDGDHDADIDVSNSPRVNDAMTSFYVSVSGLMASLDDIVEAERHATHALRYLSSSVGASSASSTSNDGTGNIFAGNLTGKMASIKRALIYCYIHQGDTDKAIKLLREMP